MLRWIANGVGLGLLAAVLLGGALGLELLRGDALPDLTPGASVTGAVPVEAPPDLGGNFELAPVDSFAAIAERPLFVESRRPAEEMVPGSGPVTSAAPAFARPLTVALSGIVRDGDQRAALVREQSTGKLKKVAEGESIDGWVVEAILAESVRFTQGQQTEELPLRKYEERASSARSPQRPGVVPLVRPPVAAPRAPLNPDAAPQLRPRRPQR